MNIYRQILLFKHLGGHAEKLNLVQIYLTYEKWKEKLGFYDSTTPPKEHFTNFVVSVIAHMLVDFYMDLRTEQVLPHFALKDLTFKINSSGAWTGTLPHN